MIKAGAYSTFLTALLVCSGASAQQHSNGERPTPSAATGQKSGSTTAKEEPIFPATRLREFSRIAEKHSPTQYPDCNRSRSARLYQASWSFWLFPLAVISLVPEYRGYEYAITKSQIAFVDPKTRRIVEVIRQYGEPRPHRVKTPSNLTKML